MFNDLLQLYGWTRGISNYTLPSIAGIYIQLVHIMYIPASVEVIRKKNALCAHVQQVRLVTVASQ